MTTRGVSIKILVVGGLEVRVGEAVCVGGLGVHGVNPSVWVS